MSLLRIKAVKGSAFLMLCLMMLWAYGCEQSPEEQKEAVAQYKTDILYRSELEAFMPPLFKADSNFIKDSLHYAKQYIDQWLKDRIIAEQARKVIGNLDKRIEARLENYKYTLINHEYALWLLARGLNQVVTEDEIRNYYEQNPDRFISRANYFSYFHIRTSQTNPYQQITWMRSSDLADIEKLKEWAQADTNIVMVKLDSVFVTDGTVKAVGEGYWNDITNIRPNTLLNYYTKIEEKKLFNFFKMLNVIKEGDMKPLSLCREEITMQILENRKQNLINQREKELFEQANKNL